MSTTITGTWGQNSSDTHQDGWETYITNASSLTNYATSSGIKAGYDGYYYGSLLKFTPSDDIPYSSDIIDARLYLYCTFKESSTYGLYVYRVFKNWVVDEANYTYYNYSVKWNTAGCNYTSDAGTDDGIYDRKYTYEYYRAAAEYSVGAWVTFDITDLVKEWVNKQSKEYGIYIRGPTSFSSAHGAEFVSSEGTDGYRPYLQITYQQKYYFSGTVLDQGSPAAGRVVVAHKRDTFEPIAYTTTSGDGSYTLVTTYSGSHYLVCLDDDAGAFYNDKILGRITPVQY